MNALFRHFSVRLWMTALCGVLLCVLVLPQWQRLAGLEWIALPVTIVFVGVFLFVGWIMNQIGMIVIRRQISEATVWERAGMVAEADGAFEGVKSAHDSFWFSPLQRQRNAEWVSGRLARFYLAQPYLSTVGRHVVNAYLNICPEDDAVAQGWIEAAMRSEAPLPDEHDLAALIGQTLSSNETVQQLLAELYLSHRRCDFEALQTYRRVWRSTSGDASELVRPLCDLLLKEGFINDWALSLYLQGHAGGDAACIEGLAAGHCWLKANTANHHDLEAAKEALAHLSDDQVRELAERFQPIESAPSERAVSESAKSSAIALQLMLRRITGICRQAGASAHRQGHRMVAWALKKPAKARWWGAAAVAAAVCALVLIEQWPSKPDLPEVPPSIDPLETHPQVVTDPFTIQVAAYLKQEDAQRFVDGLKEEGVEAFFTQAKSANRKWYQVKVSHFTTKEAARAYGESLKTKGLIDDFYVANYTP